MSASFLVRALGAAVKQGVRVAANSQAQQPTKKRRKSGCTPCEARGKVFMAYQAAHERLRGAE